MLSDLNYIDATQLVTVLNRKHFTVLQALEEESTTDFRKELLLLPQFRMAMVDATESFLLECHSVPAHLYDSLFKLQEAVNHCLGTCLMNMELNEDYDSELTEADAYRYKFLVKFMAFLKEYHGILYKHSELLSSGELLRPMAEGALDVTSQTSVSPANSGVEGVHLNLPPAVKPLDMADLLDDEEKDPEKKKYEDLIDKTAKAVFRLTVIKLVRDRGGIKFFNSLTTTGQFILFAQIVGCSLRHAQGNINGERNHHYGWQDHVEPANAFLNSLPLVKK